jgi:hypothetical protein
MMSRIMKFILMYHSLKPMDSINLLGLVAETENFPVRYGQTYRVELSFKLKPGQWIMFRIVIVILIYHRHKPIDSINLLGLVAET